MDFFKSLDYNPLQAQKSTLRTSYRADGTEYTVFGVPAQRPGMKSEILIQSSDGFDRNVPPVRMSED